MIPLTRPTCHDLLDIVFVMDSSRSIDSSEYAKEKNFVKELATILNIGSGSRASVIIYSDDPELKIRFEQFNNLARFSSAVDALPFIMKRTRIDKALLMASDVLKEARYVYALVPEVSSLWEAPKARTSPHRSFAPSVRKPLGPG